MPVRPSYTRSVTSDTFIQITIAIGHNHNNKMKKNKITLKIKKDPIQEKHAFT